MLDWIKLGTPALSFPIIYVGAKKSYKKELKHN